VTAGIDAGKASPGHQSAGWSLAGLRKGVEPGQRRGRPVVG